LKGLMKPEHIWVIVLLAVAALVSGCGFSQPPPFDPKRIEQIQIENARQENRQDLPEMPRGLEPAMNERREPTTRPYLRATSRPYGEQLPMALQEAIHRAVVNSFEVRVAGYQAAIDEARILEAESRFDPLVFAEGQLQLKDQVQRTASLVRPPQLFSAATTQPTFYQNDLTLSLTQPLLRDFGEAANVARITIARNDYRISLLDFRDKLETQLQKVEETYWKLL